LNAIPNYYASRAEKEEQKGKSSLFMSPDIKKERV
jgi:hypothetical protein